MRQLAVIVLLGMVLLTSCGGQQARALTSAHRGSRAIAGANGAPLPRGGRAHAATPAAFT